MVRKFVSISMVMVLCLSLVAPAQASWFDDFSEDVHINEPSAWEGQKRGYFVGGGLSYRVNANKEPLFNVQPPRISAGCGGIDTFWGGFSFLNPEYLVQAFQNIMAAAPAYAFDLALSSLCSQCKNVKDSLQAMANALNNAALDECGAAQSLVNFGGDSIAEMTGFQFEQGTNSSPTWMDEKLMLITGSLNDLSGTMNKALEWEFCGGFDKHSDPDNFNKCRAQVILDGSLWEMVLEGEKGKPDALGVAFTDLARGLFGDIIFKPSTKPGGGDNTTAIAEPIEHCQNMTAELVLMSMLGEIAVSETTETNDEPTPTVPSTDITENHQTPPATEKKPVAAVSVRTYDPGSKTCSACTSFQLVEGSPYYVLNVIDRSKKAIHEIVYAMSYDPTSSLSSTSIEMIQQSALPVYQIINAFGYRSRGWGKAVTEGEETALAKLTAIGNAQYLLTVYVSKAEGLLDKYYLQMVATRQGNMQGEESLKTAYNSMKQRMAEFRRKIGEQAWEMHKNMKSVLKDQLEFEKMKQYYQAKVRDQGLLAAYRGM